MNIALCFDSEIADYAYILIYSIIKNHPDMSINLFVVHDGSLSKLLNSHINFRNTYPSVSVNEIIITKNDIDLLQMLRYETRWPVEAYFRLLLPKYISESINKILYLDVDIIVDGTLLDIYQLNLENKVLGAFFSQRISPQMQREYLKQIEEGYHKFDIKRACSGSYFGSCVLLYNLEEWRKEQYDLTYFIKKNEELQTYRSGRLEDQTLLNFAFYNKTKYILPGNYFANGINKNVISPELIHFWGSMKPWKYYFTEFDLVQIKKAQINITNIENYIKFSSIWWSYAEETPLYSEIYNKARKNTISFIMNEMYSKIELHKSRVMNLLRTQVNSDTLLLQNNAFLIPVFLSDKSIWEIIHDNYMNNSKMFVLKKFDSKVKGRVYIPFRNIDIGTRVKIIINFTVNSSYRTFSLHLGNYDIPALIKRDIYFQPIKNNILTHMEVEITIEDDFNCIFFSQWSFKSPGDWIKIHNISIVIVNKDILLEN